MTDADSPDFTLAWHLAQFVPINKWFEPYEAKVVVVQVFRVYLDRFARRPRFPSAFLIEDFESLRVRAAFTRTNMLLSLIHI